MTTPDPRPDEAPAVRHLHAAYLVKHVFGNDPVAEALVPASYASLRTGGLYDEASLVRAQQLLEDLGLISRTGSKLQATEELARWHLLPEPVFVEALLQRWLVARAGLWLYAFARDPEPNWSELVPDAADKLLTSVYDNPDQRRAVVRMLAHKVDAEAIAELGACGEEAVAAACRGHLRAAGRDHLAAEVVRVSLHDDTLGFDVTSPDCCGHRHNLEVKSTGSPTGPVEFYLSRNEFDVGAADPAWAIVVARRGLDNVVHVAGWLQYEVVAPLVPLDQPPQGNARGRWASMRVTVDESALTPGLPLDNR